MDLNRKWIRTGNGSEPEVDLNQKRQYTRRNRDIEREAKRDIERDVKGDTERNV